MRKNSDSYPVTEWLVDGNLVYRLNQHGVNCDEIYVNQVDNDRHNSHTQNLKAIELAEMLNNSEG